MREQAIAAGRLRKFIAHVLLIVGMDHSDEFIMSDGPPRRIHAVKIVHPLRPAYVARDHFPLPRTHAGFVQRSLKPRFAAVTLFPTIPDWWRDRSAAVPYDIRHR